MKSVELFQINFQRLEALVDFHKKTFPKGRPASKGPVEDLLRATLVFAVGSFDAYLHKRIIEVVKIMLQKNKISEKTIRTIVGNLSMKEDKKADYLVHLSVQKDPQKKILQLLTDSLELKTFQSTKEIEDAFEMMEIQTPWSQLDSFSKPIYGPKKKGKVPEVKKFLRKLVLRRNEMVHKNDMYIAKKHHGKIKPISRTETDNIIKRLRRIVWAIEKISEPTL